MLDSVSDFVEWPTYSVGAASPCITQPLVSPYILAPMSPFCGYKTFVHYSFGSK